VGGPLCGSLVEGGVHGVTYEDDKGQAHFYRLIRIARDDFSAFAKYYHYFGTNFAKAKTAHPMLRPPQYLFRKKKRT
jgi:hypothetical protein